MQRRLILLGAVVAAGIFGVAAAWAGNPHFLRIGEPTIVYGGGSAASISSAAALASTESAFDDPRVLVPDIVVTGVKEGAVTQLDVAFEAVYVCVNGGGNVPSAANKTVLAGSLTASATFPAARNGRATGSLVTDSLPSPEEAAAATGFTCPSGQVLEFDRVVFSGLVLSVEGGESAALEGVLVSESVHGIA